VVATAALASDCVLRLAGRDDVPTLMLLVDGERLALGVVPRSTLLSGTERGEIWVAETAGEVVGFCHVYRRRDGIVTIYHLAVAPEARRQGVGRRLVEIAIADGRRCGAHVLRARCPEDLPANAFYERLGFVRAGTEAGKRRRLIVWELSLL